MNRKYILISCFLVACSSESARIERSYIKNLEEKNALLEEELKALRDERSDEEKGSPASKEISNPTVVKTVAQPTVNNKPAVPNKAPKNTNYFTIGSSEEEVLDVMGDPTSINGSGNTKFFHYESDYVLFRNGKVENYSNSSGNLKVRVRR